MKRFALLTTKAGEQLLVSPPSILDHAKIVFLQRSLLSALEGVNVWPAEVVGEGIFNEFYWFYHQIGDRLGFNPEEIETESRHRFFICSDPIETDRGLRVGLSGLEELLSVGFSPSTDTAHSAPAFTTGENDLDIIADLLLMFEGRVDLSLFSIQEWAAIAKQASDRRLQAQEELENNKKDKKSSLARIAPLAPPPSEQLDPEFEEKWAELETKLSHLSLPTTPISPLTNP